MFYQLIDSVVAGLTVRYEVAKQIENKFAFLWQYCALTDNEIKMKANNFVKI